MDIMNDDFKKLLSDPRIAKGLEAYAKTLQHKGTMHLPYYNEAHALEAMAILDKLHTARESLKIRAEGQAIATVRLKYYQGLKYLKDNPDGLDDQGKYKALAALTRCVTYADYIELHIKSAVKTYVNVLLEWKKPMLEWLEKEDLKLGDKFAPINVSLTADEVEWCIAMLEPLSAMFLFKVTGNELLIIRYDTKVPENK